MDSTDAGGPAGDIELQIDHPRATGDNEAVVVVRCIRGPVRIGTRFYRIRNSTASIDLTLTSIVFYGHSVDELDAGHTALVTLRGPGVRALSSADAHRWQSIQGHSAETPNPP